MSTFAETASIRALLSSAIIKRPPKRAKEIITWESSDKIEPIHQWAWKRGPSATSKGKVDINIVTRNIEIASWLTRDHYLHNKHEAEMGGSHRQNSWQEQYRKQSVSVSQAYVCHHQRNSSENGGLNRCWLLEPENVGHETTYMAQHVFYDA